jgi:uncharacterized protein (TIGR03437 family)
VVLKNLVLNKFSFAKYGLFLLLGAAAMHAAPRLALTQTAFTVSVVPGSNGTTQSLDAANIGTGTLNLTATSSVPWLVPTVGAAASSCTLKGTCYPVQIALQTASLAAGTYTGTVTITDPNAVDAPQFVVVTALVGGTVPSTINFYLPPGGSATQDFTTASPVKAAISPASPWLSVAVNGEGSFSFNVPYKITATAASGMSGASNATITLTGSSFAPDNKSIAVVLNVTTQPILEPNSTTITLHGVQGGLKQVDSIPITNGGMGTLTVSGVTAAAASGSWLTASSSTSAGSTVVNITADPTSLTPGTYPGTVTIASNAANSSVVIPINFVVEAQQAPVAYAGAAVNNGTFLQGEALAQGDIAAVFGDQLTLGAETYPTGLPLGTTLNGTQVLVDNIPAPLFVITGGQIDFQVPFEVPAGATTLQVIRNGEKGNMIAVNIAAAVPRFLVLNGGPYAVINTTTTPPLVTGNPSHPAKAGDELVAYVIGLGQTTPPLQTGAAAPSSPLPKVPNVKVCFGGDTPFSKVDCFVPDYAGASPTLVGLYQLDIKVPAGLPSGDQSLYFVVGDIQSNTVQITLQ